MMPTHFIVVIMSVIFLMAAQEFGGTVMMKISLKLVILPKGVYYREKNKNTKNEKECQDQQMYYFYIYQNNPSDKIQL